MTPKIPVLKSQTKEDIFGKLFQVRDSIHLAHLASKSYSEHVALGGFYDELLDLLDGLIESVQGKYGLLTITIPASKTCNCIEELTNLCKTLESQTAMTEPWILNQIDTIIELGYSTIYKLKNLK